MNLAFPKASLTSFIQGLHKTLPQKWQCKTLKALPITGTTHIHVRLVGAHVIARIPYKYTTTQDLLHQATCFDKAAPCHHTPKRHQTLLPSPYLPYGALILDDIQGRVPKSSQDFHAIAYALAQLHQIPLSPLTTTLTDHLTDHLTDNPIISVLTSIQQRWDALQHLAPESFALFQQVFHHTKRMCFALLKRYTPPIRLVGTDTHPGNFLIDDKGKAWFVDLEKIQYGLPTIDLAHATLSTSALWAQQKPLQPTDIVTFYHMWSRYIPQNLAQQARPWFNITRTLTRLRTLSWLAWFCHTADTSHLPLTLQHHCLQCLKNFFHPSTLQQNDVLEYDFSPVVVSTNVLKETL